MNYQICDAHLHFGMNSEVMSALRGEPKIESTVREIIEYFNRFNIEKGIVFCSPEPKEVFDRYSPELIKRFKKAWQSRWSIKDSPINYYGENDTLSNVHDERIIFIPFISSKDDISEIERYCDIKGNPPPGIKYYGLYGGVPRDNIFEYLDEHEMCLVLHLPNSCSKYPELLLDKVERYDNARLQVPHLGHGNKAILDALSEYDNLFIDTSACTHPNFKKLYGKKGTSMEEIIASNPEKTLAGSDLPWGVPEDIFSSIRGMNLSEKDKYRIFRGNFEVVWARAL